MNPEVIGLIAGLFTTGATLPQIFKQYKTKKAKDLSILMLFSIVIGLVLWLIYGIMINSIAVIAWNIAAIILNMTMLLQKLYYDSRTKKKL